MLTGETTSNSYRGQKPPDEKSLIFIWLLINKLNELDENILRKFEKKWKIAQSFVMFDYEDLQWEEQKNMIKKVINKIIRENKRNHITFILEFIRCIKDLPVMYLKNVQ